MRNQTRQNDPIPHRTRQNGASPRRFLLFSLTAWLVAVLGLVSQPGARAQDVQAIYTDSLQNGWTDSSWATCNFANTAPPVHIGAASIKVDAQGYQALYFRHPPFSTRPYAKLTFWIYGNAATPQNLQVQAILPTADPNHDAGQTPVSLTVATGWQQVDVSLSALGVADTPNVLGFWIFNNAAATAPTFYVDDVSLVLAPTPAQINIIVDAGSAIRTVDDRFFGLNTATWDPYLTSDTTLLALGADPAAGLDVRALRFPGGSTADTFDWRAGTSFDQFAQVAQKIHAQAMITVNYGSGTAQQAADWVTYSNKTKGYRIKYWEIGNEVYGTWETDNHTTAPDRPNDPVTYARYAADYMNRMRAADPTVKIGVPVTENASFDAWNQKMLSALKGLLDNGTLGALPDFVVEHPYPQSPGGESDLNLLMGGGLADTGAALRQQLQTYLGSAGSSVEMLLTELNSVNAVPGKQTTSLTNGLYLADNLGQALQSGYNGLFWWDLHNGQDTTGNTDSSLYGWRQYGDFGLLAEQSTGAPTFYPTFYVTKLLKRFARGGDTVVSVTTDYPLLTAYAAKRADGTLSLLVVNKSQTAAMSGHIALSGFVPAPTATAYSYGIPQDSAQNPASPLHGTLSPDVAQQSFYGADTSFSYTFAPYSATLLSLSPLPAHVLWTHAPDHQVSLWSLNASGTFSYFTFGPYADWTATALADGPDHRTRVLWTRADGLAALWSVNTQDGTFTLHTFGPYADSVGTWRAKSLSVGPDNRTRVLWTRTDGFAALWSVDDSAGTFTAQFYGPYSEAAGAWTATAISAGLDNRTRVLWNRTDGGIALWSVDSDTGAFTMNGFGPYAGWTATALAAGPDGSDHVLWNHAADNQAIMWTVPLLGAVTLASYGPYAGWQAKALSLGSDNHVHALWDRADGVMTVWNVDPATGGLTQNIHGPYDGWTATALSQYP